MSEPAPESIETFEPVLLIESLPAVPAIMMSSSVSFTTANRCMLKVNPYIRIVSYE